jgi:hypothetical protein
MRTMAIIFLTLQAGFAFSQDITKPVDYNLSSGIEKQIVLSDNFEKFDNYWLLGIEENSWVENIEEGNLYFQSLTNKPKEDIIPVILDQNRDFEIEAKIKFVKGNMEKAYGLQWGKSKSPVNQFDFYLTGNGHYTIDKYTGEFHDFVPFTQSDKVNSYTYNKLTIRKVEDKYYFFLNEHLVHTMPFEPFYGNLMGFQVAENSTILIDYFYVFYLDKEEATKSKVLIMDYNFSTVSETVKKGLPVTLKLNLKNVGNKDAESLNIKYKLPENIDVVDFKTIEILKKDEEQIISLQFYAKENYTDTIIPVGMEISGTDISNVKDLVLAVNIDQTISNEVDKIMAQNYSQFRGSGDPLKGLNVAQAMRTVQVGDYYALIIGIDQYSGEWQPLQNAVNDAKEIERILKEKYFFNHFRTLYNAQASRENIFKELEWIMQNSKEEDNVFIYYSGHGEYNEEMDRGFWVPVDAISKSFTKYISNEDIKSFLSGIRSKHTLLVADACFSGDIFRGKTITIPYENSTKYYHKIYSLNSRKAMTSGGVEPVMDKGRNGHSVFTYYFLKALNNNEEKYFDAGQLFNYLKIPVVNNSYQTPVYYPIRNTGDEGGQFVFIKKI